MAIASLLTLPISFFDGLREFEDLSRSLLLLAIVFFATAVIVENSLYIGLHLEKSIVRWTGGILVFFVYHLSKYKSDHFINHFTSVDPALISGASLLLTYLYAIFYWIVIFLSINYLFLLHNVNRIMSTEGAQGDNRLHYRGVLRLLGHVFGTLGIMVFTIYVISFDIENNTYTRKTSEYIVLKTEYFASTVCKNIPPRFLASDIGRGYFSVFDTDNQRFSVIRCDY